MAPNYMQTWGLARAFAGTAARVAAARGRPAAGGRTSTSCAVARSRRARSCCSSATPTTRPARASTPSDLDAICRRPARHGTWVLSDEIYRGAELDGRETPSIWGRYERALVTSGLSKAYGLPGLRIGWIVGPPAFVATTWAYHDYTSIAPGAINDRLATIALAAGAPRAHPRAHPPHPARRTGRRLERWLAAPAPTSSRSSRPRPAPSSWRGTTGRVNSTALTTRLREEKGVLIVPGDQFGMDGYLRIGFGGPAAELIEGRRAARAGPVGLRAEEPEPMTDLRPRPRRLRQRRAGGSSGCSRSAPTCCTARHGLEWRVVGIATGRHGVARDAGGPRRRGGALRSWSSGGEPGRARSGGVRPATPALPASSAGADRHGDAAPRRARPARWSSSRRPSSMSGRAAGDRPRARRARRRRPRRHREQGSGGVRVRRTAAAGRRGRPAFLFEGAVMDGIPIFNLARGRCPPCEVAGLQRRRQQHDELHHHGDGERPRVRRGAGGDAGGRDRRGRRVARRGRVGRRGEGGRAGQRADGRADDAARRWSGPASAT